MKTLLRLLLLFPVLVFCKENSPSQSVDPLAEQREESDSSLIGFFHQHPQFKSTAFDYPVGKPDAKGYYNAQGFQDNNHLGDDWNAVTGGDSDLGDPIYAISHGYVVFAKDLGGGWGNVVRLVHLLEGGEAKFVESIYAHCDTILVKENQAVKMGEKIATIGNAHGAYLAHLHLEIRDSLDMPIGGGYSSNTKGYLDPTKFIEKHRLIP